jgi:hypothetical protein
LSKVPLALSLSKGAFDLFQRARPTIATRRVGSLLAATLLAALLAGAVQTRAEDAVGIVASSEGTAELGRDGTWTPIAIGASVAIGDVLRTGRPGGLRLVFDDQSVVTVGPQTEVTVAAPFFDPTRTAPRSLLRLAAGKIRALVSEVYEQPGAAYEVETPTSVIGVRGTEFVIVYDPAAELTDVLGVSGRTAVNSVLDRARRGVVVNARELTQVARGGFPSPPRRVEDTIFRQYLDGLEFIGAGQAESLTVGEPLFAGSFVPEPDRAEAFPAPETATEIGPGSVALDPPGSAPVIEGEDAYFPTSVVGQPPDVIESIDRGELDVEF